MGPWVRIPPAITININRGLAQLVEHQVLILVVNGSSPLPAAIGLS